MEVIDEILGELNICWWNTGINPPASQAIPKQLDDFFWSKFATLIYNDILILGEFSLRDEIDTFFSENNYYQNYEKVDLNDNVGRLIYNNYIFFDKNKLRKIEDVFFLEFETANPANKKVAQRVTFEHLYSKEIIDFYIIHWNSIRDGMNAKEDCASQIWTDASKRDNNQICIGDFNVEPFDSPFLKLGASRCENYIKKISKRGFYNPFWEFMKSETGTLRHTNHTDRRTHSVTFDQMLFNNNLIKNEQISLLDVKILTEGAEIKDGEHYPISATLKFKGNI